MNWFGSFRFQTGQSTLQRLSEDWRRWSCWQRLFTFALGSSLLLEQSGRGQSGPPVITGQPANQSRSCGQSAALSVGVTGSAPLSYQWWRNGELLPGATASTLSLPSVDSSAAGAYFVVVTNGEGSTNSVEAILTVLDPAPYALSIVSDGTNAILSWPIGCSSYFPQETLSLKPPIAWTPVSAASVPVAGRFQLKLPLAGSARFYRLVAADSVPATDLFAPPVTFSLPGAGQTLSGIDVGDLDGDGRPEVVACAASPAGGFTVLVYPNQSQPGSFSTGSLGLPLVVDGGAGSAPNALFIRDMDGDGKPDIVAAFANGSTTVYRNSSDSGALAFEPALLALADSLTLAIADVDVDGLPDLIGTPEPGGPITVSRNLSAPGELVFGPAVTVAGSYSLDDVKVVDLNGDSLPEIILAAHTPAQLVILPNLSTLGNPGNISFGPPIPVQEGGVGGRTRLGVADFDRDGQLDLALSISCSNVVRVFRHRSSPGLLSSDSFAAGIDFPVGGAPQFLGIADFDRDGRPDIITGGCATVPPGCDGDCPAFGLTLLRNVSAPGLMQPNSFMPAVPYGTTGPSYPAPLPADMDRDGWPDLVVTSGGGGIDFWHDHFPFPIVWARWTGHGPDLGGRLSGIVASPGDIGTLVVSSPGGGVWRTIDGGLSWAQPNNFALGDYSVLHLEWDRIRSGRLYASTYSDLYASTDLGDTWTNLTHYGGFPAPLMPAEHSSDPRPFAQLRYSSDKSTIFWSRPCQGLYYSYDGINFVQHYPFSGGSTNVNNCINSIAVDDATGYVYFSTMNMPFTPRLYRSACAWTATTPCLSWSLVSAGLPDYALVNAITYGGSADVLAAAVKVGSATKVYTTSSGISWDPATTQPPIPSHDARPLVSPAPNQLLLGTVLPFQTTDWGQHWYDFSIQGAHPDNRAFYWAHFALGDYLWLTTDGGGPDGTGPNIVRYNFLPGSAPSGGVQIGISGLKVWQCFFMAVTGQPGGSRRRIFLGAIDNGCLCSDDSGGSWTQDGVPPSGGCLDYPSLVFAPSNPDRAYSRTCNGASFGRTDNAFSALTASAVSWTEVMPSTSNDLPDLWTTASITVDPLNQDHVCFANSDNVAVSSTAGNSWTQHSLPGNAAPVCVFFNKNGDLYAGTVDHGAYKSADNGGTWSPFGLNSPAPRAVFKIAHSSAGGNEGTFFLAATSGLYRKLPGGVFTRQWGPNGVYTVSDVEVHPTNPMRVAIAMGYVAQYGQHRGGVLLSTDNGTTFTSITAGLDIHQAPITDIQFDPVDPRYIHAAVFGLGAWTAYAP